MKLPEADNTSLPSATINGPEDFWSPGVFSSCQAQLACVSMYHQPQLHSSMSTRTGTMILGRITSHHVTSRCAHATPPHGCNAMPASPAAATAAVHPLSQATICMVPSTRCRQMPSTMPAFHTFPLQLLRSPTTMSSRKSTAQCGQCPTMTAPSVSSGMRRCGRLRHTSGWAGSVSQIHNVRYGMLC